MKDLKSQNDALKLDNAQHLKEIEYYKNYAKEKQAEIFTLNRRAEELELEV